MLELQGPDSVISPIKNVFPEGTRITGDLVSAQAAAHACTNACKSIPGS